MYLFSLIKGRPIVICAKGDSDLEKKGYQCLQLPEVVDCLQGILTVIPLQLLSFHIAGLRGYDVCICMCSQCFFNFFTCVFNCMQVSGALLYILVET